MVFITVFMLWSFALPIFPGHYHQVVKVGVKPKFSVGTRTGIDGKLPKETLVPSKIVYEGDFPLEKCLLTIECTRQKVKGNSTIKYRYKNKLIGVFTLPYSIQNKKCWL